MSGNLSLVLSKIPLFQGLDAQSLRAVLAICKSEKFSSGATIFNEGEPSHAMYILLEGKIDLSSNRAGHLYTLGSCEIFGEIGLITQRHRSASALALEDCKLLKIDHVNFNLLAGKQPRINSILMKNISVSLANHVVRMNNAPLEHIPADKVSETPDSTRQTLSNNP